jgi:signal transduction histidine kinase
MRQDGSRMPRRGSTGIRSRSARVPPHSARLRRPIDTEGEVTSVSIGPSDHPMRRTGFGVALNLVGIVIVIAYLVRQWQLGTVPAWTVPVGGFATLAWLATLLVPTRWANTTRVLLLVMTVGGAITAWPTNGLMIVPVIAAIITITTPAREPAWLGYCYAVIAGALIATTPLVSAARGDTGVTVEGVLSIEFAVVVALLGGINRRQSRARQEAATELAERTATMREEHAKASVLAARQSLARDMHDVLAHSLGGLVIQLDAVEAQLEAGETHAALARLGDARSMAASGLAEARRAVEALRSRSDVAASVSSSDLAASLIDLVDAHERLGGRIDFAQLGAARPVPDAVATALRRALQESLSNARKHAPGQSVTVRIEWGADSVDLTVSNPVAEAAVTGQLAISGGGRGLVGMTERFDELPKGRVTAVRRGDEFVVHASAAVPPAGPSAVPATAEEDR